MLTIPDWRSPSCLVLVWPESLPHRAQLKPFYLDLIGLLPKDFNLVLILKSLKLKDTVSRQIKQRNPGIKLDLVFLSTVKDIWVRDWAPVPIIDRKSRKWALKALYKPRYLSSRDAAGDNEAGITLAAHFGMRLKKIPLVWDIGNFTHNGIGTAIVSNRLIGDNENLSIEQIRSIFLENLGINNLIFVPVEPGDETGHVDGMVRFLSPDTLAVATYPSHYQSGKRFMLSLMEHLRSKLPANCHIIPVLNAEPKDGKAEGISSAWGNHLNFLRLGNRVLLPAYGAREDAAAIRALKSCSLKQSGIRKWSPSAVHLDTRLLGERCIEATFDGLEIIPIKSPHLMQLARLGGVLNCISWVYY